jgi:transglutaminase-like putative cysteine protease
MRMRLHVLLICLLASFNFTFAQSKKVKTAPPSRWVKASSINREARPAEGENAGYYYLIIDEQENTAAEEIYYHYAYKLLTNEGIQQMSDLMFDFDPAFQDLTIHQIRIIRGNHEINQIPKEIQTIQREQSMDRYLYDGTLTAIINLKDVRKDDIVEYSFTRRGYNPVFEGTLARTLFFNYSVPSEKIYLRYIVPSSKELRLNFSDNKEVPYEKTAAGNNISYTWSLDKVKAYSNASNIPDWFDNGSNVMITDFKSWKEVVKNSQKLFDVNEKDKEKLNAEADKQFKEKDIQKYALEVTRFVQDEIRYLGFETGLNSHKPHPPLEVYQQRFGDCKDKSLLLITLLAARGIEAYPVLISTGLSHTVGDRLPSNRVFNHCVVQIRMPLRNIYVDPTISNQGGEIYNYYFPPYGKGLVISEDSEDLVTFEEPLTSTTTEVQTFDLMTIGGEAMFSVKTTYTGKDADYQRSEFATNDLTTVQKNYLQYYANLYPDITTWEDIVVTDKRDDNVLIVEEKYKIPTFWNPYTEGGDGDDVIYCKIEPQTLASYFDVGQSILQRKDPVRLTYPIDYYHTTHINLPEEWNVESAEKIFEGSSYLYDYSVKSSGNEITRYIHYQTKKDHVPVDQFEKYLSDHQAMSENLSYMLTYNKSIATASKGNYWGVIVTICSILLGGWISLMIYRNYDPEPAFAGSNAIPIGGWLVLAAIGITLSPVRIVYDLASEPDYLLAGTGWQSFLAVKQYGHAFLALLTHVYNFVNLMFALTLAVLFYQRRSSVPRLYSIYAVVNVAVLTFDTLYWPTVAEGIEVDPKDMIRTIVATAIWVPYFNMSVRVKQTFVNRGENFDDSSQDQPTEAMLEEKQQ